MPEAIPITLPIVLAAVLIASGIAKLRRPDDLAGWAELGVPAVFRRAWLVRLHPWGEMALGLALLVLGGLLGLIAAVIALVIMVAYLWLVWSVQRRPEDASCACFGEKKRVTGLTVVRNAWLVLVAAATAGVIWANPLLGGAVIAADADAWLWIGMAAVAALTVALVLWPEPETVAEVAAGDARAEAGVPSPTPDGEEAGEYVRLRTPAVPLTLGDGSPVNLRDLPRTRPMLVFAVAQGCGGCEPVLERVDEWRALLPEVDIRLLFQHPHDAGMLVETTEPQSLHDPQGNLGRTLEDHWLTPTAVLFGIDGMLAGGPEVGYRDIEAFVTEIRDSLDEVAEVVASVAAARAEQS
ncbi:MauE/DoxX family redox-associated membrane protein [Microbacter sp. GSS18]|nr:MauE/DoxX family redox-associated membrane protein [Microbacter sp. GSS18]